MTMEEILRAAEAAGADTAALRRADKLIDYWRQGMLSDGELDLAALIGPCYDLYARADRGAPAGEYARLVTEFLLALDGRNCLYVNVWLLLAGATDPACRFRLFDRVPARCLASPHGGDVLLWTRDRYYLESLLPGKGAELSLLSPETAAEAERYIRSGGKHADAVRRWLDEARTHGPQGK